MAKGKSRKVPQRMCVSCREMKEKKMLFRLLVENEQIVYDPTGKKPGRGAYVCRNSDCIEKALQKGNLRHHLKAEPAPGLLETLEEVLAEEENARAEAERGKKIFRMGADGKARLLSPEEDS